ncbi:hypothetical protein GVAV_001083 [Gurleya vavrai]
MLKTIFEPDEIWQNLEPIHFLLFKKGTMTWDWITGIRSFNYVMIYYIPQYLLLILLKNNYYLYCHLGYKFTNAFISASCDYFTIKLYSLYHYNTDNIIFLTLISHGLWLYSPRSHINSFEMFFAVLIYYIYKKRNFDTKNELKYFKISMVLMTYITYLRPTILFMLGYIYLKNYKLVLKNIHYIITTLGVLIAIDSYIYNEFIIPPLNFFKINMYYRVSELFNEQPFYSYFLFVTVLTGILFPLAIYNFKKEKNKNSTNLKKHKSKLKLESTYQFYKEILIMSTFYFIFYSTQKHKEMRFLLPLIPFINILAGKLLNNKIKIILILQLFFCIYVGHSHQKYSEVISYIRNESREKQLKVFFCVCPYSLPAYSFLCKVDIEIKMLTQNPDIYSKCNPKLYKKFGNNFIINEYDEFLDKNYKNFDFGKFNLIVMYDWIFEKCKDRLSDFKIIKKFKYADIVLEKEKGKIMYILEKIKKE